MVLLRPPADAYTVCIAYSLARRILTRRRTGRLAHSDISDSPFHVTVWLVLTPVNGSQSSNDLHTREGGYPQGWEVFTH